MRRGEVKRKKKRQKQKNKKLTEHSYFEEVSPQVKI